MSCIPLRALSQRAGARSTSKSRGNETSTRTRSLRDDDEEFEGDKLDDDEPRDERLSDEEIAEFDAVYDTHKPDIERLKSTLERMEEQGANFEDGSEPARSMKRRAEALARELLVTAEGLGTDEDGEESRLGDVTEVDEFVRDEGDEVQVSDEAKFDGSLVGNEIVIEGSTLQQKFAVRRLANVRYDALRKWIDNELASTDEAVEHEERYGADEPNELDDDRDAMLAEVRVDPMQMLNPDLDYAPSDEPNMKRYAPSVTPELLRLSQLDPLNAPLLLTFVDAYGMTLPRGATGLSSKWQRKVKRTLRRARHMGIMSSKQGTFTMTSPFPGVYIERNSSSVWNVTPNSFLDEEIFDDRQRDAQKRAEERKRLGKDYVEEDDEFNRVEDEDEYAPPSRDDDDEFRDVDDDRPRRVRSARHVDFDDAVGYDEFGRAKPAAKVREGDGGVDVVVPKTKDVLNVPVTSKKKKSIKK